MNLKAIFNLKPHKKKRTRKKFPKLVPLTDSDTDCVSSSERHIIEDEEKEMESSINLSDISSDDAEWTSSSDSESNS